MIGLDGGSTSSKAVIVDEQGDLVQDDMGDLLAWTNTTGAGKVNGMDHHCDSWTSEAALGHLGKPADIAHAVAFLCSDQGAWISGQNLYVDGGHGNVPLMPAR